MEPTEKPGPPSTCSICGASGCRAADASVGSISETEMRLRTVLESTLDAVVTIDDAGCVIGWNKQAQVIFGYGAEEAWGRRISELIIPEDFRAAHEAGHARARETGDGPILNRRVEVIAQHRDGRLFPIELLVVPTIVDGRTTYTGFLHDITERKAGEEALRQARDQLEQRVEERTAKLKQEVAERILAQEEAERHRLELLRAEKMIAMGTLVSGVAHEINNPNQFIMLNLPLLQQAWEDVLPILDAWHAERGDLKLANIRYGQARAEIPALLSEIAHGAERIRQIVSELHDYARSQGEGSMIPLNLNELVQSALTLLASPIRKFTTRVRVELDDELPVVRGNAGRLEQVIINLVLNACQSLPDPHRGITIRTGCKSGSVVLEVEDEGVGIKPEELEHITDPFFTTKRESGGAGLGLAVSARIVNEHRASLDFESEVGRGTIARLTVPVHVEGAGGE